MTVITKERPSNLSAQRRLRDEDQRIRFTLGLRFVGFQYGPYNSAPVELYVGFGGRKYIKVSLGVYKSVNN